MKVLVVLSLLILPALSFENSTTACPEVPSIKVGGTTSFLRLAGAWKEAYEMDDVNNTASCPEFDITMAGYGDWAIGASRVCDIHPIYSELDLAGMRGRFFYPQADTVNGWHYDCKFTSERQAILIDVAYEGVALATSGMGSAAECIGLLGGLSMDQLRWIFSSYTMEMLVSTGMDPDAVPYSDGNGETRLWSELHENCTSDEIIISGILGQVGAHEYFTEAIFAEKREEFASGRGSKKNDIEEVTDFLESNRNAIAFLELGDLASILEDAEHHFILPVPIINRFGDAVKPEPEAFEEKSYPFSRVVQVSVWDDPQSLNFTRPFLEFGFSEEGTRILHGAGFWSLDQWVKTVMLTRIQSQGGVPMGDIQANCGPVGGNIAIAGSTNVLPIALFWSEIYKIGCPGVNIDIEAGGSSAGAGRVCSNPEKGTPVDIGTMTREWKTDEAVAKDGSYVYKCVAGDRARSATKVDIGLDGIAIVLAKGGIAEQCQEILGGFTVDQIRWIYSGYTESELVENGWDPDSLTNSDDDSTTHLWSELDARCEPQEIRLAGDILGEGSHESFKKNIFFGHEDGEDIDENRPGVYSYFQATGNDLVSYIQGNGDAIAYIGYNYYFDNLELLSAAPVQNSGGDFVAPTEETIGNGSYNPLVRTISMNLLNDKSSLANTVPLLQFGFSQPDLVKKRGVVPIQGLYLEEMLGRLGGSTTMTRMRSRQSSAAVTTSWNSLIVTSSTLLVVILNLLWQFG